MPLLENSADPVTECLLAAEQLIGGPLLSSEDVTRWQLAFDQWLSQQEALIHRFSAESEASLALLKQRFAVCLPRLEQKAESVLELIRNDLAQVTQATRCLPEFQFPCIETTLGHCEHDA